MLRTNRVFPITHSTQPSSGPKTNCGSRRAVVARPSNRNDCCIAETKNSFSGIEGEVGRGMGQQLFWGSQRKLVMITQCNFVSIIKSKQATDYNDTPFTDTISSLSIGSCKYRARVVHSDTLDCLSPRSISSRHPISAYCPVVIARNVVETEHCSEGRIVPR